MNKINKFTLQGTLIWGVCAIFFLYEFLLRTVIGTFQHPIMYDLDISFVQFSLLSSTAYGLIYGAMQIPVGIIVDRVGLKKSLLIGAGVCSLSMLLFAYAQNYHLAFLFRIMTGFGSSFGFICLLVSVYEWLPTKNIALLIGVSQFIGTMGPMLAAGPMEKIAGEVSLSWRNIFVFLALFGIVLEVLIFFFVKNNSEKSKKIIILKRAGSIKKAITNLFKKSQPWIIGLFSALVYSSIEYLSENEGKSYLMLKGLLPLSASYMITFAWIGYAIGCPLMGIISDYIRLRKPLFIAAAVIYTISLSVLMLTRNIYALSFSFFLLGVGASGQSIGFATIVENFKKTYLALALSLNNSLITLLTAINAPILGLIIDSRKQSTTLTLDDYTYMFTILIIIACASLFIAVFLVKETNCKSAVELTVLDRKATL
ncbi:MAG: MFS transporter [Alphaproteobacteria bacterium]|jgi:MFS family permease